MFKKTIKKMRKTCVCCDKMIKVILYEDKTYRGGHYFGKINLGKTKNPEYWECPKCYWGGTERCIIWVSNRWIGKSMCTSNKQRFSLNKQNLVLCK